jgi:Recombination endonuclease VII
MENEFKKCKVCNIVNPLSNFHKMKKNRDGRFNVCKICHHKRTKKFRKDYPEKFATYRRNSTIKFRYNLTRDQYDELIKKQENRCSICGNSPNLEGPINQRCLSIDHCHKTKKIRGLLCQLCNRGLGLFRERQDFLEKALQYLKIHD